jgi:hypothetical protein
MSVELHAVVDEQGRLRLLEFVQGELVPDAVVLGDVHAAEAHPFRLLRQLFRLEAAVVRAQHGMHMHVDDGARHG